MNKNSTRNFFFKFLLQLAVLRQTTYMLSDRR